ncbi:MAG: BatD family protein [Myxococcales bacterium]|nr:BatD family protein [Myxococcales bacterium]
MKRFLNCAHGIIGLAVLNASPPALANITVEATVSDSQVMLGDIVSVDIHAVASVNGDIAIHWPSVEGLTLIGQSEGTQMSMSWTSAGQQIRREKTLHVELSADTPGTKRIPPIVARVGRHSGESQPIKIDVQDPGTTTPPEIASSGKVVPPDSTEQDIFVRYRLSKGDVWLGQQVFLDLEIFASRQANFQVDSIPPPPDLDGFWRETLERPKRLSPRREIINGQTYQVFRAWRMALFPLQAGTRTLQPVPVEFRKGGRGFFGGGSRLRKRTRAVGLNVKPLPTDGKPNNFSSSNVGEYTLSAKLGQDSVVTGKAVVLRVTLSGQGNIKSARLPSLDSLEGFRVFPPTITDEVKVTLSGVKGQKTAEILLVPHQPGTFNIPSLELPIFRPEAGTYAVLQTPSLPLTVEGPAEPAPNAQAKTSEPELAQSQNPATDHRPLRFTATLSPPPTLPWRQPLWWTVLWLGPILLILRGMLSTLHRRWTQHRFHHNQRGVVEAQRRASRRLSEAELAAQQGNHPEVASACMDAFYASARGQLGIELQGKTAEELSQTLRDRGAPEAFANDVAKAFEEASYARYAPVSTPSDLLNTVRQWTNLAEGLKHMNKRVL